MLCALRKVRLRLRLTQSLLTSKVDHCNEVGIQLPHRTHISRASCLKPTERNDVLQRAYVKCLGIRQKTHCNIVLYWNGHNLFVHQLWEFICEAVRVSVRCPRHVGRNYVPLISVQTAWHNRASTYVIT